MAETFAESRLSTTTLEGQLTTEIDAPTLTNSSARLSVGVSGTVDGTFSTARTGSVTTSMGSTIGSGPTPTAFSFSGGNVSFTVDGRSVSRPMLSYAGPILDQAFAERHPDDVLVPMAALMSERTAGSGRKFKDLKPKDKVKKWEQEGYEVSPKGNGKYKLKIKLDKVMKAKNEGSADEAASQSDLSLELVYDSTTDTITETRIYDGDTLISERTTDGGFRTALPGSRASTLSVRQ